MSKKFNNMSEVFDKIEEVFIGKGKDMVRIKQVRTPDMDYICDYCHKLIADSDGFTKSLAFLFESDLVCEECRKRIPVGEPEEVYHCGFDLKQSKFIKEGRTNTITITKCIN